MAFESEDAAAARRSGSGPLGRFSHSFPSIASDAETGLSPRSGRMARGAAGQRRRREARKIDRVRAGTLAGP